MDQKEAERIQALTEMPVTTEAEAEAFIRNCARTIGYGFHPDTPATEYVYPDASAPSGCYPTFTEAQAVTFESKLDAAFGMLDDPYSVGLEEVLKGQNSRGVPGGLA